MNRFLKIIFVILALLVISPIDPVSEIATGPLGLIDDVFYVILDLLIFFYLKKQGKSVIPARPGAPPDPKRID